jgi:hypothetical protein
MRDSLVPILLILLFGALAVLHFVGKIVKNFLREIGFNVGDDNHKGPTKSGH